MTWIMNARMYAVTPAVEALWQDLLHRVTRAAGVDFEYVPYQAPRPLETLWARDDLGCVLMCGYPLARQLAEVVPLAAPIPRAPWAGGRAVYRSDLIVRADAPYQKLADTFGGRAGWTVEHSHSGFNAFRHHLLQYRTPERPSLYREMLPNLVTARAVLDAVREGRIDVGPLDAYWHLLIARHDPALTRGVRVVEATATATSPAFVAASTLPDDEVAALRRAFATAVMQPWFEAFAAGLQIDGFAPVTLADYARTLEWDDEAKATAYGYPA
jgi:ABC-type phosphate/phosphonate transport system substrate-binding protein